MVQRLSFDAHGKRRLADWTAGTPAAPDAETPRDFTGHEHLDSVGLIHMNGRVYDPTLGRFLSADPFVPNPTATQSFNRYSYVYNNPLSYTDPTGFRGEMDGYGGDSGGRDGGFASPDFGSGSSGSGSPSASPGDDNIGADSDRSFLDRLQDFLDSPFGKSVGGIVGGFATGAGMAATGGAVALGAGLAIAEAVDYDVPNTQQHSQYGDEYGGPSRDGAHGIQVASADRFSDAGFPHDGPGPNGQLWGGENGLTSTQAMFDDSSNVGDDESVNRFSPYSPGEYGWHYYLEGPTPVCSASHCSAEFMSDALLRHAVPGQSPLTVVEDFGVYWVYDHATRAFTKPWLPAGLVRTRVLGPHTVVNITTSLHVLHDGIARRRVFQENNMWYVVTEGYGNNKIPFMNLANDFYGPITFKALDQAMIDWVGVHGGR